MRTEATTGVDLDVARVERATPAADARAAGGRGLADTGRYIARSIRQSLRLMVGMPDYDVYLTHMAATHPERAPMSYEAFFRERLEARYGAGKGRCC